MCTVPSYLSSKRTNVRGSLHDFLYNKSRVYQTPHLSWVDNRVQQRLNGILGCTACFNERCTLCNHIFVVLRLPTAASDCMHFVGAAKNILTLRTGAAVHVWPEEHLINISCSCLLSRCCRLRRFSFFLPFGFPFFCLGKCSFCCNCSVDECLWRLFPPGSSRFLKLFR